MMKGAIGIMAKNPAKGKVKTRLAATLGNDQALKIYENLLQNSLNLVASIDGVEPCLFQHPNINRSIQPANGSISHHLQKGEDLGEKMDNAFKVLLEMHPKAILIGADCPLLNEEIIEKALRRLDQSEVVLGPSEDGGFYLIGLRSRNPELFRNRTWGHENVLKDTLAILHLQRASAYFLPELFDIDREEDWIRYQQVTPND